MLVRTADRAYVEIDIEGTDYNKAADIYSCGMLFWELWYGQFVYDELSVQCKGNLETAIRAGARPSLMKIYEPSEDWKDLICRCWSYKVKVRPSAVECVRFFESIGITG